ncbi:transcriptional regulator GcvA [Janthinobacterium sp. 551a]|uniref:transcriptional regulator GcvA n=1 Tax=Janthinobacterium sp. 551a TaxID=1566281 RepID=UPI00088461AC|nr:transcriptional regulator GcvA [Janthinobacterium sp. 551a]SDA85239.1 LysR family transcriptional regulator, glycine cleavage system transcriptional activator [Janthinobacterium sp. 551a]
MSRPLPPLAALHAFEAAARPEGFQRAGEELHVSAGAIGHHVKQLEAWLGIVLFQRLPRGVVLTNAGQRYAASLGPILNQLADVSEQARRQGDDKVVTVTATSSLVSRWLMPRLGRLRDRYPQIELRVLASMHPVDLARDGVDVAIRLGPGRYPGLKVDLLMEEWFSAVCSPDFRANAASLRQPADLLRYPLLHDEPEVHLPGEIDWTRWLHSCGVHYSGNSGNSGARFSHTYLCLDAAASGQGVAIAASPLIGDDLRSGRLVRVFDHAVRGPHCYYLLRSPQAETRPLVHLFCEWLIAEARADQETVWPTVEAA